MFNLGDRLLIDINLSKGICVEICEIIPSSAGFSSEDVYGFFGVNGNLPFTIKLSQDDIDRCLAFYKGYQYSKDLLSKNVYGCYLPEKSFYRDDSNIPSIYDEDRGGLKYL
jgi:hypothetical protein